jgi:hypothetical protein
MNVRSIAESNNRYLRNSIRAYFEERCNLRWVEGVLRASSQPAEARAIIESCFADFSKTEQYRSLIDQF